eukprot:CAMPEP_0181049498 /NCGR_PEP_ID=MMETSP1070-20121207/16013_1 /TAXON_ID=265543 /ORGANISM="Minutocellus polymorphus, Strain NH13" /LENGTH=178 /DNA_ID=CAMNT_0023128377 /DNA_START=190 /DNA_END=726 /DNA_ORIENTATION=-
MNSRVPRLAKYIRRLYSILHFVEHSKDPLELVPRQVALGLDAQTGHHGMNVVVGVGMIPREDGPFEVFKLELAGVVAINDVKGSSQFLGGLGEVPPSNLHEGLLEVTTKHNVAEAVVEIPILVAHLSDLLAVENLEGAAVLTDALRADVVGLVGVKSGVLAGHLAVAQGSDLLPACRN